MQRTIEGARIAAGGGTARSGRSRSRPRRSARRERLVVDPRPAAGGGVAGAAGARSRRSTRLTGELVVFDRESGVELVDAVAASCAVPGVWPPATVAGRRYIDGGARSGTNADLAAGAERVLIVHADAARRAARCCGGDLDAEIACARARRARSSSTPTRSRSPRSAPTRSRRRRGPRPRRRSRAGAGSPAPSRRSGSGRPAGSARCATVAGRVARSPRGPPQRSASIAAREPRRRPRGSRSGRHARVGEPHRARAAVDHEVVAADDRQARARRRPRRPRAGSIPSGSVTHRK